MLGQVLVFVVLGAAAAAGAGVPAAGVPAAGAPAAGAPAAIFENVCTLDGTRPYTGVRVHRQWTLRAADCAAGGPRAWAARAGRAGRTVVTECVRGRATRSSTIGGGLFNRTICAPPAGAAPGAAARCFRFARRRTYARRTHFRPGALVGGVWVADGCPAGGPAERGLAPDLARPSQAASAGATAAPQILGAAIAGGAAAAGLPGPCAWAPHAPLVADRLDAWSTTRAGTAVVVRQALVRTPDVLDRAFAVSHDWAVHARPDERYPGD